MVTVVLLTVQTAVVSETKLTGNPDDAVAPTVNGGSPTRAAKAPKVMV